MGIEPTSEAWEAPVLPLNYARSGSLNSTYDEGGGTTASFTKSEDSIRAVAPVNRIHSRARCC